MIKLIPTKDDSWVLTLVLNLCGAVGLQGKVEVKWKSASRAQLFATPWTIYIILQARILVWVAFPFSRGCSQPKDWTQVFALQVDSLPAEPQGKTKNTGVGSLSLLRGSFPTQGWNPGLPHCSRFFTNWAINQVCALLLLHSWGKWCFVFSCHFL